MVGHQRDGHAHLHVRRPQDLRFQTVFERFVEERPEIGPPTAQQHGIDIGQIQCGADGRGQRVDGPSDGLHGPHIMGMPCVQQTLQCLTARSRILFGHSGSLDQRCDGQHTFPNIRVVRIRTADPSKDTDT